MTDSQRRAIDDLKCIISIATDLIESIKGNKIDDVEDETYKAYRILADI